LPEVVVETTEQEQSAPNKKQSASPTSQALSTPAEVKPTASIPTATIGQPPPAYAGGQVASGARLGMLGNRDIFDTPLSVMAYTAKTIADQGARTIADVLINDPSVRSTHASGGILDSFYIRGFPLNEGNSGEIAFDGVFGVAPTYRLFTDYAERIEVVKGPTALIYGLSPNSSVGGTINVVPKRASDVDLTRVTTDYRSDAQGGVHLDMSRRYGVDRQFGVRVNGSYEGGDTAIDDQSREAFVGALALDYRGDRFRATLDVVGQREDVDAPLRPFFPTAAVTAIPEAPDGRSNVQKRWEWSRIDDLSVLGRIEYDLSSQVTVFAAAGGGNTRVERLFGTPLLDDNAGNVRITPQHFIFDVDRHTTEAGVRARFETAEITHNVTLQTSYLYQSLGRGSVNGTIQTSNIFDPAFRPEQDVPAPAHVPKISDSAFYGAAIADTMSFLDERVLVTVGGRWQHIDSKNYASGAVTSSSDEGVVTPLVGLVVKPWEKISLFANYVEGLSVGETAPSLANVINAGEVLPPYRTNQIEVGTKIDLGRFGVTFSAFQIDKPFGQLEDAGGGELVFVEGGEQRNRGLELEAFGEVASGVRLLGGVTLIEGELTKTNSAATQGNTPIGVPSVQVNLGAEWDVPSVSGVTLTGNVIYTDEQFVNAENTLKVPSWTRVDLGARYETTISGRPVTFRTKVENVLDADYWSGVASFGTFVQGAPRTVWVSMTTDF
jgi:iron complex outermembrane receptor protein